MSLHRNPDRKPEVARTILFAVLLICVTVWLHQTLTSALDNQSHHDLDQRWAAMKGYLRIERLSSPDQPTMRAYWYFDSQDREESATVERIKTLYLVANKNGRPLEQSAAFRAINLDSPADI